MNANHLVFDFVAIREKQNEVLPFEDFVLLWIVANEIAEEEVASLSLAN